MRRITALAATLLLALTACGSSETPEPAAAEASAEPVSLTDARYKKIDLRLPPPRWSVWSGVWSRV